MQDARSALEGRIKTLGKDAWPCKTNWATLLRFSGDSVAFMGAPVSSPKHRLLCDAKCITLLSGLAEAEGRGRCQGAYPFKAGAYACSGLQTYKMYHAAWAITFEMTKYTETGDEAILASVYRKIAACGPWPHCEESCPPQLRGGFKSAVLALLLLLIYAKGPSTGTRTTAERSKANIAALTFAVCVLQAECKPLQLLLSAEVASHWALYQSDPRHAHAGFTCDAECTTTAAIVAIAQIHPSVLDIYAVNHAKTMLLQTCDRRQLGVAMAEFKVSPPVVKQFPLAQAWGMDYIRRVHEKLAASGTCVAANDLNLEATLI